MPSSYIKKIGYKNIKKWNILILFTIIATLLYFNSFSNTFHFDDHHHIVNNPSLKEISNIPRYFADTQTFSQRSDITHYRPLLLVTYALNYYFGGLNPIGYHIVNLGFHVGSAFIIFLIVKTILLDTMSSFLVAVIAGIIFLIHPFNSEVVNYISARSSLMCGFFYLLAFYFWVMFRSQKSEDRSKMGFSNFLHLTSNFLPLASYFYIASLLAFLLAMLTKEIAITLPLAIWVYDICFEGGYKIRKTFTKTLYIYLSYLSIVLIPYLILSGTHYGGKLHQSNLKPLRPLWSQFSTELVVLVNYMKLMIIPSGLSVYHDMPVYNNPWHLPVLFSGMAIFAIITFAIFTLYKQKNLEWSFISFVLLWFFIVLLLTTIIPLHLILQENRGYLACVTFAMLAALGIGKIGMKYPRLSILCLIVLLIFYSITTHQRNAVWKNNISLWSNVIAKYPSVEIAHINLSAAYEESRMTDKAIDELQKCIYINPNNSEAHLNLGFLYIQQGQSSKGFEELEHTVRIKPYDASIHNDVGAAYYGKKMFTQAEQHLLRAAELDKNYAEPRYNLGLLYTTQGKLEVAIKQFKDVISIDPGNTDAHEKLNRLLGEIKLPRI